MHATFNFALKTLYSFLVFGYIGICFLFIGKLDGGSMGLLVRPIRTTAYPAHRTSGSDIFDADVWHVHNLLASGCGSLPTGHIQRKYRCIQKCHG